MIKGYEEIVSFGKGNIEALVQSGTLAAKGTEELVKAFAALGSQSLDRATAVTQALAVAKGPAELMQLQTQLVREGADTWVNESRKLAEIFGTVVTSALEPLQARVKAASDLYGRAA